MNRKTVLTAVFAAMVLAGFTTCASGPRASSPRGYTNPRDFIWDYSGPHGRIVVRYTTTSGRTIRITGYTGNSTNVRIPSNFQFPHGGWIPVTVIGDRAFEGKGLTSVTIPSSVGTIGEFAFANNRLASIPSTRNGATVAASAFWYNPPLEQAQPHLRAMDMGQIVAFLRLSGPPARGTTGQTINDDIAWRQAWINVRNQAMRLMRDSPPMAAYVVFSPAVNVGAVNFNTGQVNVSVDVRLEDGPRPLEDHMRLINGLNRELVATGRNSEWQLPMLTPGSVWNPTRRRHDVFIFGDIVTNDGRVVSRFNTTRFMPGAMVTGEHDSPSLSFGETGITTSRQRLRFDGRVPASDIGNVRVRVSARVELFNPARGEEPLSLQVRVLTEEEFRNLR
ncbi:MAG: leucine-rich repeat domain-containing protein [Treponema sp.]|nr:leucine-rich repeat domain-containing protein [Treponema sp.]